MFLVAQKHKKKRLRSATSRPRLNKEAVNSKLRQNKQTKRISPKERLEKKKKDPRSDTL